MKNKFYLFIFIFLFFFFNVSFAKTGDGELKLDKLDLEKFIQYSLGAGNSKFRGSSATGSGLLFVVSINGKGSIWYYCFDKDPNKCQTPSDYMVEKKCEKDYAAGRTCRVFARKNKIVWNNGINPSRGTLIKTNNPIEVAQIVQSLGFYDGDINQLSFPNLVNPNKLEVDENKENNSFVVEQLKTLTNLKERGILTEEEFEEAKKKLLN